MTRLLLLLAVLAGCAAGPPEGVVVVDRTELAVSADATPPAADDVRWQPRPLPDAWDAGRRRAASGGWYRARLHLDRAPGELWAVLLPRLAQNAAVIVNGHFLGDGGRFTEPVARNWNRPLLFPAATGLLHAGDNEIDVRVASSPGAEIFLDPFQVGPDRLLRPRYERQYFRQVTLAQVITLTTLAVALLVGMVFLRRDQQHAHRWTVAGIVVWALATSNFYVRDVPVPSRVWEWLFAVCQSAVVPCFVLSFHRVLGLDRRGVERAIGIVWGLGAVGLAVVDPLWVFPAMLAWFAASIVLVVYLGVLLLRADRTGPAEALGLFLPVTAIGLALCLHDLIGVVTGALPAGTFMMPYVPAAAILVAAWRVLARLVQALDESETLNRELDRRVQDKAAELARTYDQLRGLERDRAVARERERITRDIHDGLGGHLVSTLAMVEGGDDFARDDVAEALRGALDDLRLVIDSLDPAEEDLLAVLAAVRTRLEPRLKRRGVRFDWQVRDLPSAPALGPAGLLRALRIVQETITNVIKHAGASTITVRTGEAPDPDGRPSVFVSVRDDGRGFDPARAEGRGLVNMARRAIELGGRVVVDTGAAGTTVTLWLPRAAA